MPGKRIYGFRPRSVTVPGHRPSKRLSQNFLVDPGVARQIVDLGQIRPGDTVIEIGPGTGALTGLLVERAARVHAVELDRKLFEALGVQYASEPRLVLHHGDILETRIRDLVPEGPVVVVGNLPYAITSDLVLWLLEQHREVRRAVALMQREVAERLTAEPGTRAAGSLTLALHYQAKAECILEVAPRSFRPVPKVTSTLVAIRFRETPAVTPRDEQFFFRVIRAAFGNRRKTLVNALAGGLGAPRERVEAAVAAAGLDPRIRGERLTLEDFRRLADHLGEPSTDPDPPEDA
jgi:16S rRNA (adenine1518-N6/adenine1519-N6)-dimethyltransferase